MLSGISPSVVVSVLCESVKIDASWWSNLNAAPHNRNTFVDEWQMSAFNISQMHDHWLRTRYRADGYPCNKHHVLSLSFSRSLFIAILANVIPSIYFANSRWNAHESDRISTIITQYTIYRIYTHVANERTTTTTVGSGRWKFVHVCVCGARSLHLKFIVLMVNSHFVLPANWI